ncbi:hypothetical protein IRJ41_025550, partial [Triplophysa rosa]
ATSTCPARRAKRSRFHSNRRRRRNARTRGSFCSKQTAEDLSLRACTNVKLRSQESSNESGTSRSSARNTCSPDAKVLCPHSLLFNLHIM